MNSPQPLVEDSRLGMIPISGRFDYRNAKKHLDDGSTQLTVFNTQSRDDWTVFKNEAAFVVKDADSPLASSESVYAPHFMTVLNGIGMDAKSAFPDDEFMQRLAVINSIKFCGVTLENRAISDPDSPSGSDLITLQERGEVVHWANGPMPPGNYWRWNVPLPSEDKKNTAAAGKQRPTRSVLVPEVVIPRNIADNIMHSLLHYLNDETNYTKGLNPRFLTTDMWLASNSAICDSAITTMLLGMYALAMPHTDESIGTDQPTILSIQCRDNEDYTGFNEEYNLYAFFETPSSTINLINALAVALGVIESGDDLLEGIDLTTKKLDTYSRVRKRLLHTIFFMPGSSTSNRAAVQNLEYGYDPKEGSNDRAKYTGGNIKNTHAGKMLELQTIHAKKYFSSMANAVTNDMEMYCGKITTGCKRANETFYGIMA